MRNRIKPWYTHNPNLNRKLAKETQIDRNDGGINEALENVRPL